eukprot:g8663.t1
MLSLLLASSFVVSSLVWHTESDCEWALDCDLGGQDIAHVLSSGEACSGKCKQYSGCTHFAWNLYQGGTCWLKAGGLGKADAYARPGATCGILTTTGPPSCTQLHSDPYATGQLVSCCNGLTMQLADWDSTGQWFYRCEQQTTAPPSSPASASASRSFSVSSIRTPIPSRSASASRSFSVSSIRTPIPSRSAYASRSFSVSSTRTPIPSASASRSFSVSFTRTPIQSRSISLSPSQSISLSQSRSISSSQSSSTSRSLSCSISLSPSPSNSSSTSPSFSRSISQSPAASPPGLVWQEFEGGGGEWASGCDFFGHDLQHQTAPLAQCPALCRALSGCTNFAWNNYLGGTCWLKGNSLPKSTAIIQPGVTCAVLWRSSRSSSPSQSPSRSPLSSLSPSRSPVSSLSLSRSPTSTNQPCTPNGVDPYASGQLLACCAGSTSCLADWNNNNNWFYLCLASCATGPGPTAGPPGANWQLVWQDDFDGTQLDQSKWEVEVNCWGGGNGEKQCYTDRLSNVRVADGLLQLKAEYHAGGYTGVAAGAGCTLNNDNSCQWTQPFTSGRIRSRPASSWLFGRFEARIKLPRGNFLWPAFWMLPTDYVYGTWAASGEIDIMEGHGQWPTTYSSTLHHGGKWPFNLVDWFAEVMIFYLDGQETWRISLQRSFWSGQGGSDPYEGATRKPFDQRFHFILNNAVGGNFFPASVFGEFSAEKAAASFVLPALQVDWVRVYQDVN